MTKIGGNSDIQAQDAVGYDVKADSGAAAYVNVRVDGTVDDNFAYRSEAFKSAAEPALREFAGLRDELQAAIDKANASGQPNLARSLEQQLDGLEKGLAQLKRVCEEPHGGTMGGTAWVSTYATKLQEAIAGVRESGVMGRAGMGATDEASGASDGAGLSGIVGGGGASGPSELTTMQPIELAKQFGADPKGTWDAIAKLPPEERQFALMQLQQGVQENNQLFATLTNFMKAMHDTEKAILSNLRV